MFQQGLKIKHVRFPKRNLNMLSFQNKKNHARQYPSEWLKTLSARLFLSNLSSNYPCRKNSLQDVLSIQEKLTARCFFTSFSLFFTRQIIHVTKIVREMLKTWKKGHLTTNFLSIDNPSAPNIIPQPRQQNPEKISRGLLN